MFRKKSVVIAVLAVAVLGFGIWYGVSAQNSSQGIPSAYDSKDAWDTAYQLGQLEREWMEDTDDTIALRGTTISIPNRELNNSIRQRQMLGGKHPEREAMQALLRKDALYQLAVQNGCTVTPEEVQAFVDMMAEAAQQPFEGASDAYFQGLGVPPDEYFASLYEVYRKELITEKYTEPLWNELLASAPKGDVAKAWDKYQSKIADAYIKADNVQDLRT